MFPEIDLMHGYISTIENQKKMQAICLISGPDF